MSNYPKEFVDWYLTHITPGPGTIDYEQLTINEFVVKIWIYKSTGEIKVSYGYPINETYCGNGWCKTVKMIDLGKGMRSFVFKVKGKIAGLTKAYLRVGKSMPEPIYQLNSTDILILNKVSEKLQNTIGITLDYSSFTIKPEPGPKPTPKPIAESEKKKDNTILWLIFGALLVFIFTKKR